MTMPEASLVYDFMKARLEAYGVSYDTIGQFWLDLNFVYLVVFPRECTADVNALLGANSDPQVNYRNAAALALNETNTLSGR